MIGANNNEALIFKHLREEQPNPRQIEFFLSDVRHTAYGGARGGGKSWAGRRKCVMLCMRYPKLKILLLRRTMPELRENHIIPLKAELNGYATYKSEEKTFLFPNGSRLGLGYCDNDNDTLQYQGMENDVIVFEEATNFNEEWIKFISTTLRTTRTDFKPRIYYTMNPGGVSHSYFKRLFIDRSFEENENPDNYLFIPATVYDNKVLMDANPEYIEQLQALPEMKKRAHLYGDWNIFEGQVFEEFKDVSEHYKDRINTHVIDPFDIPASFTIYRSMDWGYSKPFSVNWYAVDYDGRAYMILEYYGCIPKEPDKGVKMTPDEVFSEVKRIESEHPFLKGKEIRGVADPAIWEKSTGISVAEVGEKHGIYFDKGDNKRIAGWMQVHERLKFDENGIPMLYIFKGCKDTIRTLPLLQYDARKAEDVDTSQEDHAADSLRYFCNMMPIKPQKQVAENIKPYNPLDTIENTGSYEYYIKY